jgi:hypothetical protein
VLGRPAHSHDHRALVPRRAQPGARGAGASAVEATAGAPPPPPPLALTPRLPSPARAPPQDISLADMQSPVFAGERFSYPFIPDFHAAVLVKQGLSLRWAFLLPGACAAGRWGAGGRCAAGRADPPLAPPVLPPPRAPCAAPPSAQRCCLWPPSSPSSTSSPCA